ncbi:putative membrane protein [Shimwellia blattae DSM 4481 = NBRC 105725]|uniref:Putative membrane protein n=1 Tax=Shimwellia blattae (strain ATCC 29907 / DSM 4481 / JCM 1650 / NBRC 105725 / CDC 9005-74) TaxID=630626 RepID=I2B7M5_SHIBC|nr:putative membrane protein [Shimwellia blattae DSM 4481 = NBRC 105725]
MCSLNHWRCIRAACEYVPLPLQPPAPGWANNGAVPGMQSPFWVSALYITLIIINKMNYQRLNNE